MKQEDISFPLFRNVGGSMQYCIDTAEDLRRVPELDPALFAALSTPVNAIADDPAFLAYLDGDGNGIIRLDEVKEAIRFLFAQLKNTDGVERKDSFLAPENLRSANLADFSRSYAGLVSDGKIQLSTVQNALSAVAEGPLKGDGIVTEAAVQSDLFFDVLAFSKGTQGKGGLGITEAQLDAFLAEAESYLAWSRRTEKPLFRGQDPVEYGNCFLALKPKLEEYFRFCELVTMDPVNARRFSLEPEAELPALDLADAAAVEKQLSDAPCAMPDSSGILNLKKGQNPHYAAALREFGKRFGVSTLDRSELAAIEQELAPYMEYLAQTQCEVVKTLGAERVAADTVPEKVAQLRAVFARESALGNISDSLRTLEKLILFQKHLLAFCNDFVSFKGLFAPDCSSLIKAGHLVMDARHFDLTVYVRDVAEHKKIALQSNLCLLYFELDSEVPPPCRHIAVAVTGGNLNRLYIGKQALFFLPSGSCCNAKIIDIVDGPISFRQSFCAPFRKARTAVSAKLKKVAGFFAADKVIDGKTGASAQAAPAQKSTGMGSPMLLLAGGLSLAALSAAASFVLKTCVGIMESISAMKWSSILLWSLTIVLLVVLPAAIGALLKLRSRNLTLFLEASGWALNLPMRLNAVVSRLFTYGGIYPGNSRFCLIDATVVNPRKEKKLRRVLLLILLVLLLLSAALYFWQKYPCFFARFTGC